MKCTLCDKEIAGINEAIEEGWIPTFYVGETEYGEVCPECVNKYLSIDTDGEMILAPEFEATFMASASSRKETLLTLAEMVAVEKGPYPDEELIKRLRGKFLEFSVDILSRDETIDLINHQHEQIHQLKQSRDNLRIERNQLHDANLNNNLQFPVLQNHTQYPLFPMRGK
jgi:hypothetical protein